MSTEDDPAQMDPDEYRAKLHREGRFHELRSLSFEEFAWKADVAALTARRARRWDQARFYAGEAARHRHRAAEELAKAS